MQAQQAASSTSLTLAEAAVNHLRSIGINFVALDFDKTILQVHTGGVWPGSVEELQTHVRPEFLSLIHTVVRTNQSQAPVYLSVVTFSGQVRLVRGVLSSIFSRTSAKEMDIPIRGEDGSWKEPHPTRGWFPDNADLNYDSGKQTHMLSAIQEIESKRKGVKIDKSSSILIDDDEYNVQIALQNGVRAVRLDPKNPQQLFPDLLALS